MMRDVAPWYLLLGPSFRAVHEQRPLDHIDDFTLAMFDGFRIEQVDVPQSLNYCRGREVAGDDGVQGLQKIERIQLRTEPALALPAKDKVHPDRVERGQPALHHGPP